MQCLKFQLKVTFMHKLNVKKSTKWKKCNILLLKWDKKINGGVGLKPSLPPNFLQHSNSMWKIKNSISKIYFSLSSGDDDIDGVLIQLMTSASIISHALRRREYASWPQCQRSISFIWPLSHRETGGGLIALIDSPPVAVTFEPSFQENYIAVGWYGPR